MTAAEDAH